MCYIELPHLSFPSSLGWTTTGTNIYNMQNIHRRTTAMESTATDGVTDVGVQVYYKKTSMTVVFLRMLRNFSEEEFYRTLVNACF